MTAPRRNALIAGLMVVAGGLGAFMVVMLSRTAVETPGGGQGPGEVSRPAQPQQIASSQGSTVSGAPATPPKVVALRPPADKLQPAFWVDVLEPGKVHKALASNAWLNDTAGKPVGRGFLGPWGVFFGTRGQDIGARFDGMVLDLFTDALLADPYRVLWLTGEKNARAPVVVVPEASGEALTALKTLVATAGKGGYSPQGCPGDVPPEPDTPDEESGDAGAAPPKPAAGLDTIHRVVLADHALFVAAAGKRLVLSMRPDAVLHGLCLKPFQLSSSGGAGSAVELGVSLNENGRALQGLAALLGLGGEARLALGQEGDGFTPRGLVAPLARPGRLAAGPLDASMLKLVPETTGVFVALNLVLPAALDAASLGAAFGGKPLEGKTVKRQVIVLWNPRGDFQLRNEVAVIWSRAEDETSLDSILSQRHLLAQKKVCGHLVFASTEELLRSMEASCAGSAPSVLSAAPAVAQGLQAPTSLGLHVSLGQVLSQLAFDGWLSEPKPLPPAGAKPERVPAPPEIDAARKQLEALPVLHWRAVLDEQGKQLTPGGFRS